MAVAREGGGARCGARFPLPSLSPLSRPGIGPASPAPRPASPSPAPGLGVEDLSAENPPHLSTHVLNSDANLAFSTVSTRALHHSGRVVRSLHVRRNVR